MEIAILTPLIGNIQSHTRNLNRMKEKEKKQSHANFNGLSYSSPMKYTPLFVTLC